MIVAVEDLIGEAIARKLIKTYVPSVSHVSVLKLAGNTYLKSKAKELNRAARNIPVLMITDLDSPAMCARGLIDEWVGGALSASFLFRVAVMEIESWVIADREKFAEFLAIPPHLIPDPTDSIANPKEFVLTLASRARSKELRADLLPALGSFAKTGPAYNPRITEFVNKNWSARRAVRSSPSLRRTVERLKMFAREVK